MANYKLYWPLVQDDLQSKVSVGKWEAWFADIVIEEVTEGCKNFTLSVPSKFNKKYLDKNYKKDILNAFKKFYPNAESINIVANEVDSNLENLLEPSPIFEDDSQSEASPTQIPSRYSKSDVKKEDLKPVDSKIAFLNNNLHNLSNKFSFDNYVVAGFNELVVSVSKSILKSPGALYNPFFIHSATGLGKTHLLQAIGNKYLEMYPNHNIKYISTETFLNHYISSMQKGKGHEFREYYRSVDLLLVDDIQFISGKTSTQEAFFHTFNELHQMNKQIIITSDKNPKMLVGIEQRLVSRFEWGMVCELSDPTVEDRLAVIREKVHKKRMAVTETQMLQIATSVNTNFRDIEGVLNKIEGYLGLNPGRYLDKDILNKVLNPYLKMISSGLMHFKANQEGGDKGEFEPIFEAITNKWSVNKADVCSKKRDKYSVQARQVIMYVLHRYCKISMASIGRLLGGRDHTTIVHGCKKIEKLLKTDMEIQVKIRDCLVDLDLETGLF